MYNEYAKRQSLSGGGGGGGGGSSSSRRRSGAANGINQDQVDDVDHTGVSGDSPTSMSRTTSSSSGGGGGGGGGGASLSVVQDREHTMGGEGVNRFSSYQSSPVLTAGGRSRIVSTAMKQSIWEADFLARNRREQEQRAKKGFHSPSV